METRAILKNKYYLYMTEFFAGMSVMAVELGASRLLAPYFSSSQIVWTIIIGTIMIAMALGNIWGGRSADKNPNPDKLYMRMIIASIWIAAIPAAGKYVIMGISAVLVFTVNNNFLIWAAFLACMIIFVYPLFLLGTVTPSLVKYTVDSLDDSGKTVGTLGAINTVGSIIGTFLPTFVTIPAVGTSITFLLFSGILLVLGMIYFTSTKAKKVACTVSVILFIICSVFGHRDNFAFADKNLLYEGESIYNYLQVKDTEDSVVFATNALFGVQSVMMKDSSLTGMYYDYALAAPVMSGAERGENAEVLVLGMGTGTYASQCLKYFKSADVEGVEIDQKITDLAGKYFNLPNTVKVTTYDGRAYLNAIDKKYDVIMVDAYQDITIPFQMSSVEFFTMVKDHLKKDGIMVVNMNMHTEKEGNINQYLSDTIANVFNTVYTVNVDGTTNRELFATQNTEVAEAFKQNTMKLSDYGLRSLMGKVAYNMKIYEKGKYLLTDDKAPVELLGMQVIDELIKNEMFDYKETFKKEGIKGVLNSL
jgi:spermidine synthase